MEIKLDHLSTQDEPKIESEEIAGTENDGEILDSVDIEEFDDVSPDEDLVTADDDDEDDLSLGIAAEFAAATFEDAEDEMEDSDVFDDEPVPAEDIEEDKTAEDDNTTGAVPQIKIISEKPSSAEIVDEPVPAEDFVPEVVQGGKTAPAAKSHKYRYPAVAAVVAAALLATPVLGIAAIDAMDGDFTFGGMVPGNGGANVNTNGNTNSSGNGNANGNTNGNANGNSNANANANVGPEVVYPESKVLHFAVDGPGHIEPVSNCEIDGATGEIKFLDTSENASFRIVKDVEGASVEIHCGDTVIDGDIIVLQPLVDYPDISFKFVDEVALAAAQAAAEAERIAAEQAAAEEAARQAAEAQEAATRVAQQQSQAYQAAPSQPTYTPPAQTYVAPAPEPTYVAPAPAPAPAPVAAPAPAISVPMNATEWETAWSIWNSYTAFRASKGVPQVVWSDYCALLAYNTCVAEAQIGRMQHEIAIPGDQRMTYSDILQYSTWRKAGPSAVDRWDKSEGHHRMMRNNNGTTEAGVGVYYDGSKWWYTIVYNFSGCNQYQGPL